MPTKIAAEAARGRWLRPQRITPKYDHVVERHPGLSLFYGSRSLLAVRDGRPNDAERFARVATHHAYDLAWAKNALRVRKCGCELE